MSLGSGLSQVARTSGSGPLWRNCIFQLRGTAWVVRRLGQPTAGDTFWQVSGLFPKLGSERGTLGRDSASPPRQKPGPALLQPTLLSGSDMHVSLWVALKTL